MTTLEKYSKAMLERAAEVYDKARDLIMERGWWRSSGRDSETAVCVESAIGYAITKHEGYLCGGAVLEPENKVTNSFGVDPTFMELTQLGFALTARWNDSASTTVDMVYDRLMRAAKECREEVGRRSQVQLDKGDTNE